MAISATIAASDIPAANADMEALGHGPGNFSVALRENETQETATHGGLHLGGRDPGYLEDLQSLQATYPSLVIRQDEGEVFNFSDHIRDRALDWSNPAEWVNPAVQRGDEKEFGGTRFRSREDNNVWTPDTKPPAWERV